MKCNFKFIVLLMAMIGIGDAHGTKIQITFDQSTDYADAIFYGILKDYESIKTPFDEYISDEKRLQEKESFYYKDGSTRLLFKVDKVWKGKLSDQIEIFTFPYPSGFACNLNFQKEGKYIMMINKSPTKNSYVLTGVCGSGFILDNEFTTELKEKLNKKYNK